MFTLQHWGIGAVFTIRASVHHKETLRILRLVIDIPKSQWAPPSATTRRKELASKYPHRDWAASRAAAMSVQNAQAQVPICDQVRQRVRMASSLFHSVKQRMRGKTSLDFPAVLESVLKRRLSDEELTELGFTSQLDPEGLVKRFWYVIFFEAAFAAHPHASIPVHLLPGPEPGCYLSFSAACTSKEMVLSSKP